MTNWSFGKYIQGNVFLERGLGEKSINYTCYGSDYIGTQTCKQPALTDENRNCNLFYIGTLFQTQV